MPDTAAYRGLIAVSRFVALLHTPEAFAAPSRSSLLLSLPALGCSL